jgi:hypothetical protein
MHGSRGTDTVLASVRRVECFHPPPEKRYNAGTTDVEADVLLSVVACPHCQRVQVIEAASTTTTCRGCAKRFDPAQRKRFYTGDDAGEARRVAAKTALHVAGAGIEAIAESMAAQEREVVATWEDAVTVLEGMPEFGRDNVEAALREKRVTMDPDRVLEALRSAQRLWEPRPGRYRWL